MGKCIESRLKSMKNKDNIPKARVKKVVGQPSISPYLSKLSLSEMSLINGGLRMEDGTFFGDLNSYLRGKVDPITGKPDEIRFGNIEDYPYKPK